MRYSYSKETMVDIAARLKRAEDLLDTIVFNGWNDDLFNKAYKSLVELGGTRLFFAESFSNLFCQIKEATDKNAIKSV